MKKDSKKINVLKDKKKLAIILSIILGLFIVFLVTYNINNNASVYYRTYSKEKGWTSWVKNGQVSGKKGCAITAIQIKVKSTSNGNVFYDVYTIKDKWTDKNNNNGQTSGNKKNGIRGIKVLITDAMLRKYNVYYRTHNKKDNWLAWAENSEISGNGKYSIDQIQIIIKNNKEKFDKQMTINTPVYTNFN